MYKQNSLDFGNEYEIVSTPLEIIKKIDDQSRMRLFQQKTHLLEKTKYPELYKMKHKDVVHLLYEYHDLMAKQNNINPEILRRDFIINNSRIDVYEYDIKEKRILSEKSKKLRLVY